jgi:hypothetical protein
MRFVIITTAALLMVPPGPTVADNGGCEKFAWSLGRDRARFASADKLTIVAGDQLPSIPANALVVRLQPGSEVNFAISPERTPKTGAWFGGTIRFAAPHHGGIYQVTLSDDAWLDIVQDNRFARSVGHTGRSDCPGVRKSVRLELLASPFVLQLSGAASESILIAISSVASGID